jgi:hypothetical protein
MLEFQTWLPRTGRWRIIRYQAAEDYFRRQFMECESILGSRQELAVNPDGPTARTHSAGGYITEASAFPDDEHMARRKPCRGEWPATTHSDSS